MKTLSDLEADFRNALAEVEKEYQWYASRRWYYFGLSWVTRLVAASALVMGVLLPLSSSTATIDLWGNLKFAGPAQAALACIALAGLIIGANQVFLISASWTRYAGAMMKLKTLDKTARFDWEALKLNLAQQPTADDCAKALMLFKSVVVAARQIVEEETTTWSAEIIKAVDHLKALIQEQKTVVESLAKEEKKVIETAQKLAAAPTLGTLRLKVEDETQRLTGPITISVGSVTTQRTMPISVVVLAEIPGGIQKVALSGSDAGGNIVTVENVVQVSPNAITELGLHVPKG